ncbi:hypothetical protein HPB48_004099 [Haemaphysalis longicornis]|uniref:AMP-binding enzyme C-terminal domain-containing protein n=1 Tax=Haemaphysalis longicornis TaxID=44386 RepID=A0A9J6FCC9_HAELO|nr:hypothetical protein HPB48_004099 [Haemaphysalis longicornis]
MDLQVAPAELEELLQDHADVAQAAVVGVPHSTLGEAARAFVVLKTEARPKTTQEEESKQQELVKYIESKLTFTNKVQSLCRKAGKFKAV